MSKTLGRTPVETPTDRSQTPQGETGSPRTAAEPAICDPGYHASGPWCSRCGQWFVDGEWRNTPPETTQLAAPLAMALGLTPADEPRSPRPPAEMPRGYFQPYCSCPPHDGPCRTADEEPTRSPRAPKSAFECLCATDPDGCPIHRHYPADVHSDDVMLSAVISEDHAAHARG